jgi:hypothetical protein
MSVDPDSPTTVIVSPDLPSTVIVDGDAVSVLETEAPSVVVVTPSGPIGVVLAVEAPTVVVTPDEVVSVVSVGILGPPGPQGPQGPPGNSAATLAYIHDQQVPLAVWTIDHNLGFIPGGITVIDTLGETVWGQVAHPSANQTILTFSAAFSGVAYLS